MQAHTLSDTCRTCLTTDDSFLPLFTSDHHLQKTHFKSLAQCIMAFTDIYMSRDDGLPGQVCATCARKAVELHNFRRQCINNDKILRNTFKPTEVKPEVALDSEVTEKEECCLFEPEEDDNDELEEDLQITFEANTITDTPTDIVEETVENIYLDEIETLPSAEMLVLQEEGEKANEDQDESPQIEDEACEKVECVLNAEEEKTNLKCPMCEKIFTQQTEFDSHLNSHMNKKNQCTICAKAFTKPSHLTRHLYTHEPVKPYNCKQCNKGFARLQQYTNHVNMHTGVKPHMCKQCGKGFNQISNLKDHMRTHNGEKPFLCSVCGKGFNQLGNLRQHTIRHSGVKAHLCTICGTGFASKGELGAHTRKHTGAKPFVCNICNHGFTTSSSLTKHKRIHSGEKPYECEVCKMRFSRSGILSRHKRTHTGEKPYACPHCTRAFAQSNDLASHLRIHTGERPFVCDVCGQAFRQTSALKTHKKVHRNRDAPPKTEREPAGIGVGVVKKEMAVANGAVL